MRSRVILYGLSLTTQVRFSAFPPVFDCTDAAHVLKTHGATAIVADSTGWASVSAAHWRNLSSDRPSAHVAWIRFNRATIL